MTTQQSMEVILDLPQVEERFNLKVITSKGKVRFYNQISEKTKQNIINYHNELGNKVYEN